MGFFSFLNAICYLHRQSLYSGETFILPSNLFALKSDVNSYYWKILWKYTKLTLIEYIPIGCLHGLQQNTNIYILAYILCRFALMLSSDQEPYLFTFACQQPVQHQTHNDYSINVFND